MFHEPRAIYIYMVARSMPESTTANDVKKNARANKQEFVERLKNLHLPEGVRVGVLLLHGLTGMPNEMRPVAQALESIGCTVEVPMLAGHGNSHKEMLETKWTDWVAGARESLNKLCETCDTVVVGGLSMGAIISLILAAENKKVAGVVAMSTTIYYDGKHANPWQRLLFLVDIAPKYIGSWFYWTEAPPFGLKDERLQRIILKQLEKADKGDKTQFGQFRTYAGSLRQLQHMLKEAKKKAAKLTCPVLIMHSAEDTLTSVKNAETLYSWLGTNDKHIILLDGCDHVLTLDLKKEEVAYNFANFTCRATTPSA